MQDDDKQSRWNSIFGKELELNVARENSKVVLLSLSGLFILLALLQLRIVLKSFKVAGLQTTNRINDLFQVMACVTIPMISTIIATRLAY